MSHFQTIIFDLDGTLYPRNSPVMTELDRRMGLYMERVTGLPPAEAHTLRKHYWRTYGTTLNGLQKFYHVDAEDYLAYTHGFDARDLIRPNPALNAMIAHLPQRKLIFTNGTREHADNILRALDLENAFDDVLSLRDFDYRPKPDPKPYDVLRRRLLHAPQQAVFVEDSVYNLPPAHAMGMTTVWLTPDSADIHDGVDCIIHDIIDLEQFL
ncbi:MAG: pyrimidine 5'-nucleotidase [Anaerolineae bacterium]|nr:pyrimidine 5'-nucleotidase [Anaerolineae bacterium]